MNFWKQYCEASLAEAFLSGDTKDICKAVLLSGMNSENITKIPQPIIKAIARLTKKTVRSIQLAFKELESLGFGKLRDESTYVVSEKYASKSKNAPSTGITQAEYPQQVMAFLAEFYVLFDSKHTIRRMKQKEIDMNVLIQVLTKQLETKDQQLEMKDSQISQLLELVQKIACGATVTAAEAQRHLTLVKK